MGHNPLTGTSYMSSVEEISSSSKTPPSTTLDLVLLVNFQSLPLPQFCYIFLASPCQVSFLQICTQYLSCGRSYLATWTFFKLTSVTVCVGF